MSNIDNDDVEGLAGAFAALSNPQRLRIFIKLAASCCATQGERQAADARARLCCAGELGDETDLAASTVSHHLKELRQAGLMHVARHGRRIDCWASREMLQRLAAFLAGLEAPRVRQTKRAGLSARDVAPRGGGR